MDVSKKPILIELEDRQLSAVVFVQDYLQLQFDGAIFTAFVWPLINRGGNIVHYGMSTYRNVLCDQIAKKVREARETDENIILVLADDTTIVMPLDEKYRQGAEAATLQLDDSRWSVW